MENNSPGNKSVISLKRGLLFLFVATITMILGLLSMKAFRTRKPAIFTTSNAFKPSPFVSVVTEEPHLPHHYIGSKNIAPYQRGGSDTPCEDAGRRTRIYNLLGNDTLVNIHIQKTGGSDFLRHLVTLKQNGTYLCELPENILKSIRKRKDVPKVKTHVHCPKDPGNPDSRQWLISEKTLGWKCGIHPTYTEYKGCVSDLDQGSGSQYSVYRYMTILRHPVLRYLSEYEHVYRGAHWTNNVKPRQCNGEPVSVEDMPPCYEGFYKGKSWKNVTLNKFMDCESNWANNRQVLWLADLESAGCFSKTFTNREEILLASAKCNLEKMAFFGLTEYMEETSRMFEKVFNVTITIPPSQVNITILHTAPMLRELWQRTDLYDRIAAVNSLDMKLYEHALRLFARRAADLGIRIDLQKIDNAVQNISGINKAAKKFKQGDYNLPEFEPS